MRRRTVWFAIGLVLALTALLGTGLTLLVRHVPGYYRHLEREETPERRALSGECVSLMSDLLNDLENGEAKWGIEFTSEQLNSFFQQDFRSGLGGESDLPKGLSEPRVSIENDHLRLGIRYGTGFWSSIITLELRVWLVANETNMIALEIEDLKAGALPLSPNLLLDQVTETLRGANMSVTWYRHEGRPVAILQYQADQLIPTLVLQRLEFTDGKLAIAGSSTEARQGRSALKPAGR